MRKPDSSLLECEALTKAFAGVRVLKGVSLRVGPASVAGLAGENGAGKSTLMNLIGGIHQPDSGQMRWMGEPYTPAGPLDAVRAGIAFVHQELNLFGNLSIADNLFLTNYGSRRSMQQRARDLLARVELTASPDTLVESLPPGERQLVEIARALSTSAKLIIFDEPTTSLSHRETSRLFAMIERLREDGISMVYISHALEDLKRVCDTVTVMRDGEVAGSGDAAQFPIQRIITMMVGRPIEQLYPARPSTPAEEALLCVRDVSQPGVVEGISFDLHPGEVLGVAGLMGSGRSEVARILFGLDPLLRGEVVLDGKPVTRESTRERIRLGMAMLTESRRADGLFMDASVRENLEIVHQDAARVPGLATALHVSCANLESQPVRQLSGGNQQKVALGKWLVRSPRVLILDEPTRGVDIGAKYEIYSLINELAGQGVAILAISSELEELMGMCDRILAMRRGEIRQTFARPFDRERILEAAL